ncbi:uncharacterized protein PAC_04577 [Phialocephala subalpina]|uniref:Uncharacterized protein n=1 Tax=Phialocephala subalpina TaxID=576137 RepID=A0A1L7WPI6_9HELO|nr:uncharacterized protein PAC_04577 [Phialocephala subalpina]
MFVLLPVIKRGHKRSREATWRNKSDSNLRASLRVNERKSALTHEKLVGSISSKILLSPSFYDLPATQETTMDQSAASPQLEAEIAALTQSVAQLETEISGAPYPLCKPATRVINLERFRKAQHSFLSWNENGPILLQKSSSNTKTGRSSSIVKRDGATTRRASNTESNEHSMFRTVEDDSCLLVGNDGNILTESEDIISPNERAKMRVLAVLRSYMHNLESGTLVTGDKVDTRVAAALKNLLNTSQDAVPSEAVKEGERPHEEDGLKPFEKSDEEGVVDELRRYKRGVLGSSGGLDNCVAEVSRAILDWKRA